MPKYLVLEIKTLNGFYYTGIVNGKYQPYWDKQLSYYQDAAAAELDAVVDAGTLVVNRNSGEMAFIPVNYTEWRSDLDELEAYYEAHELPPCDAGDFCPKCSLYQVCKGNGDMEIEEFIAAAEKNGLIERDGNEKTD